MRSTTQIMGSLILHPVAAGFTFLQALIWKKKIICLWRIFWAFLQKLQIVLKMAVGDFTQFIERKKLDCQVEFSPSTISHFL